MREGFEFPVSHDVWLPLKTAVLDHKPRSGPPISVLALLAPGNTIETAQAELTTAGRRAATALPATHQHLEPCVRPYAMMVVPGGPGGRGDPVLDLLLRGRAADPDLRQRRPAAVCARGVA